MLDADHDHRARVLTIDAQVAVDFGDPLVVINGTAPVGLGQRVEDAFCEVVNIVNSGIG